MNSINNITWPELALVMTTHLLCISKHTILFVEEQKQFIKSLDISKNAKDICMKALDSIEIEKGGK